ncbi:MAG: cation:proton antiporter [Clostridia bacterium]|nr:cation:proton antiporter [Clostridia bacterium]
MQEMLNGLNGVSKIIVPIAIILISGFLLTRITKKLSLPNVTGYIIAGILIGPYCLDLIPQSFVAGTGFLPDIALALIAFSTGQFFKMDVLKQNGLKVVIITLLEALMASVAVFMLCYFALGLSLAFSIVLAALASATAPASTMMTIRQTNARGDFVNTLLQVVALDDVVSLLAYGIAISVAVASTTGGAVSLKSVLMPLATTIGAFIAGVLFGILMSALVKQRSTDNRLIIALAMLTGFCGLCAALDISPLLGCMGMSTAYMNITGDDKLFKQLNYWSPPVLLMFFVRSGVSFNLGILFSGDAAMGGKPLVLIGVLYFIVRIGGKYLGAFLGCKLTRKDKKVTNYLGLALIPQAGVAIGLAALGARTLGGESGSVLETVILSSSVLYELIGPGCAKLALHLSGSYSDKLEDMVDVPGTSADGAVKSETQLLIERIQAIQKTLPPTPEAENEEAFNKGAEDYLASYLNKNISKRRGKR